MLQKNCHKVLESQKSKLTLLELVFKRAGTINPPPITHRVKRSHSLKLNCGWPLLCFHIKLSLPLSCHILAKGLVSHLLLLNKCYSKPRLLSHIHQSLYLGPIKLMHQFVFWLVKFWILSNEFKSNILTWEL